jgi:hypothetical protein
VTIFEALNALADIAEIATATVAVMFFRATWIERYNRRQELGAVLRTGPTQPDGRPKSRTVAQLSTELWMSHDEIIEAARYNSNIERGLHGGTGQFADRQWLRAWRAN